MDPDKGFTCKCGEEHEYTVYVYAHTRDKLVFTCQKCKTQYEILRLRAREIKPRKKTKNA